MERVMMRRIKYLVNLIVVVLMLAAIAIGRDGTLFGTTINEELFANEATGSQEKVVVETKSEDGLRVINSTTLANKVVGFGGPTPLKLFIRDGVIERVEPLKNSETPSYFKRLSSENFFDNWNSMTLGEAATTKVDAVSGATFSSVAVASTVAIAAAYAADVTPEVVSPGGLKEIFDLKGIAGLLVILLGVYITLRKPKSKVLELVQMVLNVVVLGFWCGSFLSLSQFVSWISNGINLSVSVVTVALLVVTVVMPLLGRKGSYCSIHCPMGSAQALMAKVPFTKIKITPTVARAIGGLRYCILCVLLFVMWMGVGFELMDFEVFSAFIVESASLFVLILAVVFLVLSMFITRPYCRFICPTGALITVSQRIKD